MKKLNLSEYSKNILTLITGTFIAQVIPLAISPLLTRMYSPEDFGVLAIYLTSTYTISYLVSLRYEQAIVLPKSEEKAKDLVAISIYLNIIISLLVLIVFFIFRKSILSLFDNEKVESYYYLIPISIFIFGLFNVFNNYAIRLKKFKSLSNSNIYKSIGLAGVQLTFNNIKQGAFGLIMGNLISVIIGTAYLYFYVVRKYFNYIINTKEHYISVLKKYKNFPLYDLPATLFVVCSFQLIPLLFNYYFTTETAGYYFLTQRVLATPAGLISNAVSDVFKERAAKDYATYGNAKSIYISTFNKLTLISFFPSIILYFSVEYIFTKAFGTNWQIAGIYAKLMIPMFFLRFISVPLSTMFNIGEKQKLNLILQIMLLSLIIFVFYFFHTEIEVIKYLTLSFSIFYILQLTFSAKIAKVY